MATEQELMAQRLRVIAQIKAKGGQVNAPKLAQTMNDIDAQLKKIRGGRIGMGPAGQAALNNNPKTITDLLSNEQSALQKEADDNAARLNPDTTTPFGTSKYRKNPDGTYTLIQELDASGQEIKEEEDAFTKMARELANERLKNSPVATEFKPELTERTSTGNLEADRARIEEQLYGRLTKNVDRDYRRSLDEAEQAAVNRGVDINSENYRQNSLTPLNERFDGIRADARAQAVQMGGQEYQRDVDIGETLRTNDLNTQGTIRSTNVGEISGLAGAGAGLRVPSFQPYQGAPVNTSNPTELYALLQQGKLDDRQMDAVFRELKLKAQALRMQGANRGGGGGTPQAPAASDPFKTGPLPLGT